MKHFYLRKTFLVVIMMSGLGFQIQAQIPQTPSIQMLLTDNSGNPVSDGSYGVSVSLYDVLTGGSALWTETQSLMVSDGLANIILGTVTPLNLMFDKQYFVGLAIDGGSELTPRLALNPSTYSLSARAVYGSTNIFPDDGDVGIGTLTPMAKLDVEGKLRVADVPEVDTFLRVLVHDSDDQIIKSVRLDSMVHIINTVSWEFWWWVWPGLVGPRGPQGPKGDPGPPGGVGGPGDDLIVRDSDGNIVFSVDAETGESYHKGAELFEGGLVAAAENGAEFIIGTDGTITVTDEDGNPATIFRPDGTSWHKGLETYAGGLEVTKAGSSAGVEIHPEGAIVIKDADGNEVTRFNPDGTSTHTGLETFEGGIKIPLFGGGSAIIDEQGIAIFDAQENVLTSFNALGDSEHAGLETFKGGIKTVDVAGEVIGLTSSQSTPSIQAETIQATTIQTQTLMAEQKNFRIDHPLDPENKYLYHASLESDEMANIYNGNVTLDKDGKAEITLPDWFDALNENFRYQLTPIGAPGPNLFVSQEVKNNRFKISGGTSQMKVSWLVVGTRKDKSAIENPLQVEAFKETTKLSVNSKK